MSETPALPLYNWRCGACHAERPLGRITALGAVSLIHSLRTWKTGGGCRPSRQILVDLAAGTVAIHCSHCHDWRALRYDRETGTYAEASWTGIRPGPCSAGASPQPR